MNKLDIKSLPPTMSRAMGEISHYHEYLWDKVTPYMGERIIEIGVGYGQYSRRILDAGKTLLGCDIDEGHLEYLKNNIASEKLEMIHLDLSAPEENAVSQCRRFKADTVILLNVLEHIENHCDAIKFLNEAVPANAKLIMILPALQWLYNGLDREAGHFRRYNMKTLQELLKCAGWSPLLNKYFNMPGVPGWLLAGILSRRAKQDTELNAASTNMLLRVYDRFFVQTSIISDPIFKNIMGLSILSISVKR